MKGINSDWRHGFVFVGNLLCLDFLNTAPVIEDTVRELLPDGSAVARWLGAAGYLTDGEAKQLDDAWAGKSTTVLRGFRERLRRELIQLEKGLKVSTGFISELNALLARYRLAESVASQHGKLTRAILFRPRTPEHAFAPIAHSVLALLTARDSSRLRKCPTCVLHFYDTSKKGSRQWCSMNMCGNRAKVATYYHRHQAADI